MNTTLLFASEKVNRLVRTITNKLGTHGLPLFSFAGSPLISACLVFAALSKTLFSASDAGYAWHEEAHFAAPQGWNQCLHWGLIHVLHVSGDNAVHLSW